MQTKNKTNDTILNSKVRDSAAKIIFGDNELCAQFLRDYIDLPFMKDIRPEDIEDVSDKFVPVVAEERDSDCVKKVTIKGNEPFFFLSLIEHKTQPEYNVCMQIFRYMVYIWDSYEKEMEKQQKGISKRADFKYPPIIPIVYYEGTRNWTVPISFKERIMQAESFGKYIPDFSYYLVPIRKYSNEELLEKGNEISLIMLINKIQKAQDIKAFGELPKEQVEAILSDSPEYLRKIIAKVLKTFLIKANYPIDEAEMLAGRIEEKQMGEMFENMEGIDVMECRRLRAEIATMQEDIEVGKRYLKETQADIEAGKRYLKEAQADIEVGKRYLEKAQADIDAKQANIDAKQADIIKGVVEFARNMGQEKSFVIQMIVKSFKVDEIGAQSLVEEYWH